MLHMLALLLSSFDMAVSVRTASYNDVNKQLIQYVSQQS